ncbi:MAG TPA: hypothetical protein PL151_09710 [Phycisphaerae bacterium]|nr:hypothetical protein [Phycisphaerae bacterium]HOJ76174.1 hypothetical protein [Phycisphaerae bacterium]HOM53536.1 hypothetical protein [Phycisphaerae bacterium]HON65232.1 hypothetical protein [Phycisphaerae bacterium]HOQ87845.1 hypothetical protein [Phycisphaerae bacterium]
MAKSKYSPALFEVMNRQKDTGKLGVPKWWKPAGPQAEAGKTAENRNVNTVPATTASSVSARPDPAPSVAPSVSYADGSNDGSRAVGLDHSAPPPGRFPGVRFEDGRIYLSLTPTHAAVVCGALLIVVLTAFQAGRGFNPGVPAAAGPDELRSVLNDKPNAAVLDQPTGKTDSPPSRATAGVGVPVRGEKATEVQPPAPPEELQPGLTYVLLDKYPRDALKTAEFVQKWLAEKHNIQTVLRQRRDSYWLIGKTGFDFSIEGESARCDQYIEQIKSLGRDCRRELIRAQLPVYGFASPMKFKLDPAQ